MPTTQVRVALASSTSATQRHTELTNSLADSQNAQVGFAGTQQKHASIVTWVGMKGPGASTHQYRFTLLGPKVCQLLFRFINQRAGKLRLGVLSIALGICAYMHYVYPYMYIYIYIYDRVERLLGSI